MNCEDTAQDKKIFQICLHKSTDVKTESCNIGALSKEIPVLCTSEEKILFESNQVSGIQFWVNRTSLEENNDYSLDSGHLTSFFLSHKFHEKPNQTKRQIIFYKIIFLSNDN